MFVIEVPYFNLDQIYASGQCPRWIKLKESKYVIPFRDKALKIEQQRDKYDWTRYRLIMSCTEDDFYNVWFNYLDLRMDCLDENSKVALGSGSHFLPVNLPASWEYSHGLMGVSLQRGRLVTPQPV